MVDLTLPAAYAPAPAQSLSPKASQDGLADDAPTLLNTRHASIIDAEEGLAAVLSQVQHRQAGRRIERSTRKETTQRQTAMDPKAAVALSQLRSALRTGALTFGAALEKLCALFPDPEELALVLAGLRDDADLDTKVQAEVHRALAELMQEHGQARLTAGLNTRHVVAEFAAMMNVTPQALRSAYRVLAGASSDESVTYRYLIDTFGFARRGLALDFLEQALAADIAADTPTHPPEEFQPLLALLFQLRLLRSADAVLLSTAGFRRRRAPHQDDSYEPDLFDEALVDLLLATLSDIQSAAKQFKHCLLRWLSFSRGRSVSEWAGRVLRAIAEVPTELFPDMVYRQALLTRLAEVADELFYSRRGANAHLRGIRV